MTNLRVIFFGRRTDAQSPGFMFGRRTDDDVITINTIRDRPLSLLLHIAIVRTESIHPSHHRLTFGWLPTVFPIIYPTPRYNPKKQRERQ
jgi:hypothetical protein